MHVARLIAAAFTVALLASGTGAYAATFGSPPSGQIPVLYNDQHVYAKPDILRSGRVLAALVKNGIILVPLRSMFEAMGASVSYDAATKSFTVQKSGASIQLTLGKSSALVNGESRPLDQAPIVYQGIALVPIRVISETMGGYVQWVQERRIAVVRYLPPTPVPTPVPTVVPTPVPTPVPPLPTPAPAKAPYQFFIQGGLATGKNFNEFVAGSHCWHNSYVAAAAWVLPKSPFALKVDFRQNSYVTADNFVDTSGNHFTIFDTIDGGVSSTPVFLTRQTTLDGRLEYKVADPRIYIGVGYLTTSTHYGYPHLNGAGVGLEKLPDFTSWLSYFASIFYYPSQTGNYTVTQPTSPNLGTTYRQQYSILKYDVGIALMDKHVPVYLYGGWSGDQYGAKSNAPINQTHSGPYFGLGVKF